MAESVRDRRSETTLAAGRSSKAPVEDPFLGRTLQGRYKILKALARGGMGRVYEAEQIPLGRRVAVKVLSIRGGVDADEQFHERFFREAKSCAQLTHPNTVVLHDYGCSTDGVYFLVLELLKGQTLKAEIDFDGPFDGATAAKIGVAIAGSLHEAHEVGLVHRDLKPSNVYVVERGEERAIKVIDFGLVKRVGGSEDTITQAGSLLGSPRYMSPEQVIGLSIDRRSDIYSLGALLFRVVTGRPLFEAASDFEIMNAHLHREPPTTKEVFAHCEISDELEAVIQKCVAKEKDDRFEKMSEVVEALRAVPEFSDAPLVLTRAPHADRATPPPVDASSEPARGSASTKHAVLNAATPKVHSPAGEQAEAGGPAARRSVPLLVVAALGLIAALAYGAWSSRDEPGPPEVTEPTPSDPEPEPAPARTAAAMPEVPAPAEVLGAEPSAVVEAEDEAPEETRRAGFRPVRNVSPPTTTVGQPDESRAGVEPPSSTEPSMEPSMESTWDPVRGDNRDPWAEEPP